MLITIDTTSLNGDLSMRDVEFLLDLLTARAARLKKSALADEPEEQAHAKEQERVETKKKKPEPEPEPEPVKEEPVKEEPVEEEPVEEEPVEEESTDGPTVADALEKASELISNGGAAKVKAALAETSAGKVSALEASEVADFIKALEK